MDGSLEFRRNPIVLIMLAVVGAMQGLLAAQNLMYGRHFYSRPIDEHQKCTFAVRVHGGDFPKGRVCEQR